MSELKLRLTRNDLKGAIAFTSKHLISATKDNVSLSVPTNIPGPTTFYVLSNVKPNPKVCDVSP